MEACLGRWLRPLPVRHPEELVRFVQKIPQLGTRSDFPYVYYRALTERSTTLTAVFGEVERLAAMNEPAPAERPAVTRGLVAIAVAPGVDVTGKLRRVAGVRRRVGGRSELAREDLGQPIGVRVEQVLLRVHEARALHHDLAHEGGDARLGHDVETIHRGILKTIQKNLAVNGTMSEDHKIRFASKVMNNRTNDPQKSQGKKRKEEDDVKTSSATEQ